MALPADTEELVNIFPNKLSYIGPTTLLQVKRNYNQPNKLNAMTLK